MDLDWLTAYEGWLRWYALLIGFATVGVWENFGPRRELRSSTPIRWLNHLGFGVCSNLVGVWVVGFAGVGLAVAAQSNPYGLLSSEAIPFAVRFCAGVLLIDLYAYLLHRLYHAVPWLWRIHEAHHSDPDFDLTTGLRFHPLEALIGALTGTAVIYWLAPPPSAMAFRQVTFIYITFFSHSNVHLPERIDRLLRRFVVTPDMHRIHHSNDPAEQRHNYGGYVPWWDHLFGTYQEQPALGHEGMGVGSAEIPERECLNPAHIVIRPFRSRKSLELSRIAAAAESAPRVMSPIVLQQSR